MWGEHILLPLIPHLLVSLTLIPALGNIRRFLMLFAPDFSWIARICGSFADNMDVHAHRADPPGSEEETIMTAIITSQDAGYALDLVTEVCARVGPGLPGSPQERERAFNFSNGNWKPTWAKKM